jgi:hypothetical protein
MSEEIKTIIILPDEDISMLENAFKIFNKEKPEIPNSFYEYPGEDDHIILRYIYIPYTDDNYPNLVINVCKKHNFKLKYIVMFKSQNKLENNVDFNNLYSSKKMLDKNFPSHYYPTPKLIVCTNDKNKIINLITLIFPFELKVNLITIETS